MKPDAVNYLISDMREPYESLPKLIIPIRRTGQQVGPPRLWRVHEPSPRKAWEIGPGIKWVPRNWIGDEDANVVLLEDLPGPTLSYKKALWTCANDFAFARQETSSPNRKSAIALTWLKFKGVSADGIKLRERSDWS